MYQSLFKGLVQRERERELASRNFLLIRVHPLDCSPASSVGSGSRPNSTGSLRAASTESSDRFHSDSKRAKVGSAHCFVPEKMMMSAEIMSRCPPNFSHLFSNPFFMSPAFFKPMLAAPNTIRPLNLSMSNPHRDGVLSNSILGSMTESSTSTLVSVVGSSSPAENGSDESSHKNISSTQSKRNSPGLMCVVCGDTSSGMILNILYVFSICFPPLSLSPLSFSSYIRSSLTHHYISQGNIMGFLLVTDALVSSSAVFVVN